MARTGSELGGGEELLVLGDSFAHLSNETFSLWQKPPARNAKVFGESSDPNVEFPNGDLVILAEFGSRIDESPKLVDSASQ